MIPVENTRNIESSRKDLSQNQRPFPEGEQFPTEKTFPRRKANSSRKDLSHKTHTGAKKKIYIPVGKLYRHGKLEETPFPRVSLL